MAKIPFFDENMDIISALGDVPGTDDNLSASGLKARFDKAGNLIKKFLNDYVIPAINGYVADNSGMLGREGGQMQGTIDMDGNKITNLPSPSDSGDATPKSYVDSAAKNAANSTSANFTAEIGTTWTEGADSTGPYYSQSIVIPEIHESDIAFMEVQARSGGVLTDEESDNFGLITSFKTNDGFISVFTREKTEVPIKIQLFIHRKISG